MGLFRSRFLVAGTVCLLLAATIYGFRARHDDSFANIVFTTIEGERIALRDWRGHPVLVTFWASDCRSCIEEMPRLSEMYRRYSPRGLKMVGVAMFYDLPSQVLTTVTARAVPYPIALDAQAQYARAFDGVRVVPNSFLIGPDGQLSMHSVGLVDLRDLSERIERFLREI